MKQFMLVSALASLNVAAVLAQSPKYPPLSEYMMTQDEEVALARSAAPEKVSGSATVKILTASGYRVAAQGDNGFVCMVMRGWTAPTPKVTDDAGTPFAVVVIPVDGNAAVAPKTAHK